MHYAENKEISDPCRLIFMPPMSTLLEWQRQLQSVEVAVESYYVEFSYTIRQVLRFDLEDFIRHWNLSNLLQERSITFLCMLRFLNALKPIGFSLYHLISKLYLGDTSSRFLAKF